ncbi:hypothetical protein O7623_13510 [Solwaraspora sp. WMMD791]|nr:hypothetical protein [Solwaraspora sp. WMMD791]WFE30135.1 hypothetical protein O7623_13510 [Solwaraspora sp. WMMD791]
MQHEELTEFDVTEDEFDAMLADSDPARVAGPLDDPEDPARQRRAS